MNENQEKKNVKGKDNKTKKYKTPSENKRHEENRT